jgi:5-methylcytosine-specific restriction endonuclease McrA
VPKTPEEKRLARNAYMREWNKKHPEKVKTNDAAKYQRHKVTVSIQAKKHYEEHKEDILARNRAYWHTNKEKLKAKNAAWRAANKDKLKRDKAAYYAAHQEETKKKVKEYATRNPERARSWSKKKKALRRGAPDADFTAAQWELLKAQYKHCCAYCGNKVQELTQDHITPLSKGGRHTLSNIVPACRTCNSKKNAGDPLKPVQPLLL